jgi:hypothetical protein
MWIVLLVDFLNVPLEYITDHLKVLSRLDHQLAGVSLGDLNILLE